MRNCRPSDSLKTERDGDGQETNSILHSYIEFVYLCTYMYVSVFKLHWNASETCVQDGTYVFPIHTCVYPFLLIAHSSRAICIGTVKSAPSVLCAF
jgi:hypothetical protein